MEKIEKIFEACNYVMLFLCYILCFNSVLLCFFFIYFGECCVEVELLSGRIDFFSLLCRCCSVVELSGRIDFFSLLCRGSSRILLAGIVIIDDDDKCHTHHQCF